MRKKTLFQAIGWFFSVVMIVAVGACAPEPMSSPGTVSSMTPSLPPSAVPGDDIATPIPVSDAALLPTSTATTEGPDCASDTMTSATQYEIDVILDWSGRSLAAEQRVLFRNDTGKTLKDVVFNVEVNREQGFFDLRRVTVADKRTQNFVLEGAQLTVRLDEPLAPGCATEIGLTYKQTLPKIRAGYRFGHRGYWGYSDRQINLGLWFPLLAVFDSSEGWLCPAFHDVGEYYVLGTGDFAVDIAVKNAPEGIRVAGPGTMTQNDDNQWHFELNGGRELTLSVSNAFKTLMTETESGVEIELFYLFDSAVEMLDAPRYALGVAVDAVTLYENLYGPYPYERLVVVEGDFPDGMEFSGLVFVSEAWFRTWQGTPNDWLTIITAHEISHQWWYGLVGNDQGRQPYLDEALAVYSELLFFEEYYPEHVGWWWDFRVNSYAPGGYVDATVYDFNGVRAYINVVYLRGALLVDALRAALGDQAFFSWLTNYAETMTGQVAYPADFWGMLSEDEYAVTEPARASFLQYPEILPTSDTIP